MMRIGAIGDVHIAADSVGSLRPGLTASSEDIDVLLFAGDLTKCGTRDEAELFVAELADVDVPMVAVLGNHDYHSGEEAEVSAVLRDRGIDVLEGGRVTVEIDGRLLGVAGTKGFGGGFAGTAASAFGEPEMKAFVCHTQQLAAQLCVDLRALAAQGCDRRVALLHYAPIAETVRGEPLEIFPFLGSQLLGEAVDEAGADLVLHGHAHAGTEHGTTPNGVPVRNVALPVVRSAYRVYQLGADESSGAAQVAHR